MKKPSMFSERYGKAKKRVRLRRNLSLAGAALVLFLLFFLPYLNGKIQEFKANGNQFGAVTTPGEVTEATKPAATAAVTTPAATSAQATSAQTTAAAVTTPPSTSEASLSHGLTAGGFAQIRYRQEEGGILYLGAQGEADSFHFDVSPDGSKLLILDPTGQSLTIYGQALTGEDHSFDRYDNRERGIIERQALAGVDGFIWMGDPHFLDNDTILYESQLSLAMDAFYLWAHRIADNSHRLISGTKAQDAELLERTESGYRVRLDQRVITITPDLEVAE